MYARYHQIEGDQGQLREQSLDERLAPLTLGQLYRPMNSVQQFRCRNRRDHDRFIAMVAEHPLQIEFASFCGNEHTRVDHYSHGVSGNVGWFCAISVTVSR